MSKWRPNKDGCLYVLADIHGGATLLDNILKRILPLRKKDKLIFLGDYVDRHIDSHKVLDKLIELKNKYGDRVICLAGNHELMMIQGLDLAETPSPFYAQHQFDMWRMNGGVQTIAGYVVAKNIAKLEDSFRVAISLNRDRVKNIIPKKHLDFLTNSMDLYYEEGDMFFVHGGFHPEQHPSDYSLDVLSWDRSLYKSVLQLIVAEEPLEWPKQIITGHNKRSDGQPIVTDKFLMLDCGSPKQLLVIEAHTREAFMAKPGKRLLKFNLKNTVKDDLVKKSGSVVRCVG